MYIGIIGSIGIGKSMLTKALSEHLGYRAFYEPVTENPYLDDFYSDMKRFATIMQFYMLTQRFKQHMEIQKIQDQGNHVVQDQIIFGDIQYARLTRDFGYMEDRDYETYRSHFSVLEPLMRLPDVVILLETSTENAIARIRQRGRESEVSITKDYLEALSRLFVDWAESVKERTKVLRLDWSSFQPVDSVVKTIEDVLHVQLPLPISPRKSSHT